MSYTSKIPELVEQLALQTVLIEPDDIMALGSILEKLELIEKEEKEGNFPSLRGLGGALKRLVEKIVLQEFPNPQEGCQLLREGIRVLQQRLTPQPSSPVNEEEKNFYKKIESFFDSPQEVRSEKGENSIGHANDMADSGKDLNIYMDFISEGMEHLSAIELHIINLEQEPANQETINAIFRPFHTIKGVAGFLNLHEIQKFSHAMESLLDDARNGRLSINQEIIDFILDAVDVLKGTFLDLKGNLDAGRVGHAPLEMDSYLKRASAPAISGRRGFPQLGPKCPVEKRRIDSPAFGRDPSCQRGRLEGGYPASLKGSGRKNPRHEDWGNSGKREEGQTPGSD
jgi:two-component system chemotaxis sensor kinase CheA